MFPLHDLIGYLGMAADMVLFAYVSFIIIGATRDLLARRRCELDRLRRPDSPAGPANFTED